MHRRGLDKNFSKMSEFPLDGKDINFLAISNIQSFTFKNPTHSSRLSE